MQRKGLARNTIDKYYTKSAVVKQCCKCVKEYIQVDRDKDLIIEPSAGNGAFIGKIKRLCENYKFYDLEPEHDEIIKRDFLEFDPTKPQKKYNKIHIIGNPPFGRQASMAIKFIKRCCEFADTISFILPKSFKKESMKKHFSTYYHLIHEFDLANNSFLVNEQECDVPCIFQIWERRKEERSTPEREIPQKFKFVDKDAGPDISVRRVGVYAGKISKDIEKSKQSHYFIKFTEGKLEKNLKKLKDIHFDFDNTVGPRSISKPELIAEFNHALR